MGMYDHAFTHLLQNDILQIHDEMIYAEIAENQFKHSSVAVIELAFRSGGQDLRFESFQSGPWFPTLVQETFP